jgi:hypothetical protein
MTKKKRPSSDGPSQNPQPPAPSAGSPPPSSPPTVVLTRSAVNELTVALLQIGLIAKECTDYLTRVSSASPATSSGSAPAGTTKRSSSPSDASGSN